MNDTPSKTPRELKDKKAAKKGLSFVLGFMIYAFTTACVLFGLAFWWGANQFNSAGDLAQTKNITIERGTDLTAIAHKLFSEKAINNPYIFIFGTRISAAQDKLQAGEYEITPNISPREIMVKMRDGDTVKRQVTVREGLTSYEVVVLLNAQDDLIPRRSKTLPTEGSLLPDTYRFQKGEEVEEVIVRMEAAMQKSIDNAWETRAEGLPFNTKEQAITLASIVEKETAVPDERERVAGVFINRLERGIPLQTDPTVIYAITKGVHKNDGKGPLGRRLLRKDLQYDSPYNTYKNAGLPPGPIANPGEASIRAVLNPEKHDYIYFVADGTGGHVFSKTLAEHNANVAKWRKIRREKAH